jgi:hypothetical protein
MMSWTAAANTEPERFSDLKEQIADDSIALEKHMKDKQLGNAAHPAQTLGISSKTNRLPRGACGLE